MSTGDMICCRTSSMQISMRAPCLIDLIWRYSWTVSPWTIDFDEIEKRNLNAFFEHRMNPNRSKTTCPRFCRVACCLRCAISCLPYCWCWHIIIAGDHEFESNLGFKSYIVLMILGLSTNWVLISLIDIWLCSRLRSDLIDALRSTSIFLRIRTRNNRVFVTIFVSSLKSYLNVLFNKCIRLLMC